MTNRNYCHLLGVFLSVIPVLLYGQEVGSPSLGTPFTTTFTSEEYRASPQIWDIKQDSKGRVYFGTGAGLTQYDGERWMTVPIGNATTVRAIAIDESDRIYAGGKGEFGYFEEDSLGRLQYTSLSQQLAEQYQDFKDVWQMAYLEGKVYFAPFEFIAVWDGEDLRVLPPPNKAGFRGITCLDADLYVRHPEGMLQLQGDTLLPARGSEALHTINFANLYPYNADTVLVSSAKKGLYWYTPKQEPYVSPFPTSIDTFLTSSYIYTGTRLSNGHYALVSLSKGVMIMDKQGREVNLLNKRRGLSDDVAYSIHEDFRGNIWIGTNNGLSYVEYGVPFRRFGEDFGITGQVLSIRRFGGELYVGTTSELSRWNDGQRRFLAIGNSKANFYWDLVEHQGRLFTATNTGLAVMSPDGKSLAPVKGVVERFFEIAIDSTHPEYLFTASRTGIHAFRVMQDEIAYAGKVSERQDMIRSLVADPSGNALWAGTGFKGLYRIDLNWERLEESSYVHYDTTNGLPSMSHNYPYTLKGEVRVGTVRGLRKLEGQKWVIDEQAPIPPEYAKASIYPFLEKGGHYWIGIGNQQNSARGMNRILQTKKAGGQAGLSAKESVFRRIPTSTIDDFYYEPNRLWVGCSEGLYLYLEQPKPRGAVGQALITQATAAKDTLSLLAPPLVPYKKNTLAFEYSATFFEASSKVAYQYWLVGNDEGWSEWTSEAKVRYTNVYEGNYTFKVRAKNVYGEITQEASLPIEILAPWYRSNWAKGLYLLGIALLIWGIVRWNSRRLLREKELLEAEVLDRTKKIRSQNAELFQQREEIKMILESLVESNQTVERANQNMTDSITYASRIQKAILPYKERLDQGLDEYFIFLRPRDIVSGDYYWFQDLGNKQVLAVADCTGHGVPGAFMSMIGSALLDQAVVMKKITDPGQILDDLHQGIQAALHQKHNVNNDGMDISICVIDKERREIAFAGARNSMLYIVDGALSELKADRQSIGGVQLRRKPFTTHRLPLKPGKPLMFYLYSDGFQDQFGGAEGRKIMRKQFKQILLNNHQASMPEQEEALDRYLYSWMHPKNGKSQSQVDDIIVLGARITLPKNTGEA